MANWMNDAWTWTKDLIGDTDYGDLVDGAKFAISYFDDDKDSSSGSPNSLVNLSGKIKTSISAPRSATANKIAKSPITSNAEAAVAKHRNIMARAINQATRITATSKRT
tara:strand:+ start:1567 stop:1893 length:327 start_codon:yes stop_codon:yes gene_type:complete